MLGEDAELLWEVYVDMEPEDVASADPAFTDFVLESPTDFIASTKPIAAAVKTMAGKNPGS
ncbi:hypothetical protein NKH75_28550 [Mesorhizobium sp. M0984]|uniref:hypothetical protein n=1 Tax=unclassified Mesorhizobium TaxID=325217 RepID=UPI0033388D43